MVQRLESVSLSNSEENVSENHWELPSMEVMLENRKNTVGFSQILFFFLLFYLFLQTGRNIHVSDMHLKKKKNYFFNFHPVSKNNVNSSFAIVQKDLSLEESETKLINHLLPKVRGSGVQPLWQLSQFTLKKLIIFSFCTVRRDSLSLVNCKDISCHWLFLWQRRLSSLVSLRSCFQAFTNPSNYLAFNTISSCGCGYFH